MKSEISDNSQAPGTGPGTQVHECSTVGSYEGKNAMPKYTVLNDEQNFENFFTYMYMCT